MAFHTNDGWLQINENRSWNVFSRPGLGEEGVEGVVSPSDRLVTWHLSVRLDTVLQAVQLPARISDLHSGLTDMNTDALAL